MFSFFKCCTKNPDTEVKTEVRISITEFKDGKAVSEKVMSSIQYESGLRQIEEVTGIEKFGYKISRLISEKVKEIEEDIEAHEEEVTNLLGNEKFNHRAISPLR